MDRPGLRPYPVVIRMINRLTAVPGPDLAFSEALQIGIWIGVGIVVGVVGVKDVPPIVLPAVGPLVGPDFDLAGIGIDVLVRAARPSEDWQNAFRLYWIIHLPKASTRPTQNQSKSASGRNVEWSACLTFDWFPWIQSHSFPSNP